MLLTNASMALVGYMQNDIQKLGFAYGEPNGTMYGVTQESVNLIGIAVITTIAAIGCCCYKWCTKEPVTITINPRPKPKTWGDHIIMGLQITMYALGFYRIIRNR